MNNLCFACKKIPSEKFILGFYYCIPCYDNHFKERLELEVITYKKPNQILENLWLGDEECSKDKSYLKSIGVSKILIAGCNLNMFHPTDFEYMQIEIDDFFNENILQQFDKSFEFIEKNNGKTLVHCAMGISRSPTIVIAYLMKKKKMTLEDAWHKVKSSRKIISPNKGFVDQLKDYEKLLGLAKKL